MSSNKDAAGSSPHLQSAPRQPHSGRDTSSSPSLRNSRSRTNSSPSSKDSPLELGTTRSMPTLPHAMRSFDDSDGQNENQLSPSSQSTNNLATVHQTNCKISLDLFDDEKAEEDPEKVSQNLKVSFFDFQQGKAQVYKTNP